MRECCSLYLSIFYFTEENLGLESVIKIRKHGTNWIVSSGTLPNASNHGPDSKLILLKGFHTQSAFWRAHLQLSSGAPSTCLPSEGGNEVKRNPVQAGWGLLHHLPLLRLLFFFSN